MRKKLFQHLKNYSEALFSCYLCLLVSELCCWMTVEIKKNNKTVASWAFLDIPKKIGIKFDCIQFWPLPLSTLETNPLQNCAALIECLSNLRNFCIQIMYSIYGWLYSLVLWLLLFIVHWTNKYRNNMTTIQNNNKEVGESEKCDCLVILLS